MQDEIHKNEGTNITTKNKSNFKRSKSQEINDQGEKLQKLKDASLKDREISTTLGRYKRPNNADEVVGLSKSQQITISKPLSKSQTRIWPGSLDDFPSPSGSKPFPLEKSKSKSGSSLFVKNKNLISNEDEGGKEKKKKGRWKSLLSVTWFGGKQDKNKNEKSKVSNTQTTEDSESFIFKPNESAENKPTTPSSTTSNITENNNREDTSEIVHSVSQEISDNVKGNNFEEVNAENQNSEQNDKNINDKTKKNDVYNVKTPTEIYNDSRKEGKQDSKAITSECNNEDILVNKPYNVITPSEILSKKLSISSPAADSDVFNFDSPNIYRKNQEKRKARLFLNINQIDHSQTNINFQSGGENMQPIDHSQANINSQSGSENVQPIYQNNYPKRLLDNNMQQQNFADVQDNIYSNTQLFPQVNFKHSKNLPQKQNIYNVTNNAVPYVNNIQGRPLPPRPLNINPNNKGPYIQEDNYGINCYYPKYHMNDNLYDTGTYNSHSPQPVVMGRSRDHLNLPLRHPLVHPQNEVYFKRANSLNYGKQIYAQPSVFLNNNQIQISGNNIEPIHHPVCHSSNDANVHQQQIALYRQRSCDLQETAIHNSKHTTYNQPNHIHQQQIALNRQRSCDLQETAIHNSKYTTYNQPNFPRQRSVTVGNVTRDPIYANNISHKDKLSMPINKNKSIYVQKNNETHVRPFINKDSKTGSSQQAVNQMKNNPNTQQEMQYQLMQVVPRHNHVKRSHSSVAYTGISDSEYIQLLRNQDHHNISITNQPIYGYSGGQYKSNMVQHGAYGVQKRINVYREPPTYDIYNNSCNQKSYPRHPVRSGIPVRRSHSSAFPSKNVYQVQPNSRADLAGHQSPTIHRLLGLNKSDLHIRRSKSMAYQNAKTLQQEANRVHTSQYMHNPNMYVKNYTTNEIQENPYQNGINLEAFDEVDRFRSLSLHNSTINTPLSRSRTSLTLKDDNDQLPNMQKYGRNESYPQYPSFNKTAVINTSKNVQINPEQNVKQTSSLKEAYDNQNLYIQMAQKLEVETDINKIRQNKNVTNTNNVDNEHMNLLQNSTSSNQTINNNRHKPLSVQNSTSSIQSESSQPLIDDHLEKHKVMLFKEFGVDMDGLIINLDSEANISETTGKKDGPKPVTSSKTVEIKTSTEINTETENETEPTNNINEEKIIHTLHDGKTVPTSATANTNNIRLMEPPSSL